MPKRTDIKKILVIGSGPIVIGQACEFDYSGTQACKALKEEGYEVILINSNPASIMTDPEFADKTYIEPITPEMIEKIIIKERPDALLPTIGGQTALNNALAVAEMGVLDKYDVELIGAKIPAIKKAEDRELFKEAMDKIGLGVPESDFAYSVEDAVKISERIGFPLIIRPAFTLGGTGGGVAYNLEELKTIVSNGVSESPINQVLVEQSVLGWKEYELEVMRDLNDNVVIICSIENFDPMGIHTGDSITVAPAQTLTDKEYQRLRDYSLAVIREIGVETGGSNIQFAVNPDDGRVIIIEMNPRVSRSSALASKATGFPIAKIAAKLAVGYTLDEIPNDITKKTPASFEPTIDYVITKLPRFAFEKFPAADATLNTTMKSVGETMAIGRTFKESFQKAYRGLEIGVNGFDYPEERGYENLDEKLTVPNFERVFYIKEAFSRGYSPEDVFNKTKIDPWFLDNLYEIYEKEQELIAAKDKTAQEKHELLREAKAMGFSDKQIAVIWDKTELEVRECRKKEGIIPVYKTVDTCGAEFESFTPYHYSTYEEEDEVMESDRKKIMILGGGPNRIGQGIEFDYCCVHASFCLREDGFETIMVNSNPETVSTDYDTSDRLYFEPVTYEDVLTIVEKEKPVGVIVQFGGQTPLKLALALKEAGVPIIGTSPDDIDMAEDRERFGDLLKELEILQPYNGIARSEQEAIDVAREIGYPVMVRPSYVLGGRAMETVFDEQDLKRYIKTAVNVADEHPVLIDKFLENAVEVDVDAVADGTDCVIAGIMEHIEEAGIHSGDSACVLPTFSIGDELLDTIKSHTHKLAKALNVKGLMNIQFAIKNDKVFVLEVNPRASRTVPFVSKATGIPWAKVAARVMSGKTLKEMNVKEVHPEHISVKEAVLPFNKFTKSDTLLGPEMKSTGEVMGISHNFGNSLAKAVIASGGSLPESGCVFISVRDKDKREIVALGKRFENLGYRIIATKGTAKVLKTNGVDVTPVNKVNEGRPNIVDVMKNGEVTLVVNTPLGKGSRLDDQVIRSTALKYKVFSITTLSGANATLNALESMQKTELTVKPLQDYNS